MSVNAADTVSRRIVDVTADCGISLVASLPDGWITSLITHYSRDAPAGGRRLTRRCIPNEPSRSLE
jgi:hypothetical protein